MNVFNDKKKRKIFIPLIAAVLVLALIIGACAVYLGDYYRADIPAIQQMLPEGTSWKEEPNGNIVFEPDGAKTGFIFYPGGKVEYTAYIPLMQACAERGILCVLVEMPFNLAVFGVNSADGIQAEYPEIETWYIGGHSLGGSMAASYAADNAADFEGLILLASYSTADLAESGLSVLSVYGSEDKVLNAEKYEANKVNLPADFSEHVLAGGCHAYFGVYGAQAGDGTPTVSNAAQIAFTAEKIAEFIN
ncbi:MAG: alpha/beta hydrolase [Clostridia bacterium]|nr:alpha/beta hydrolase [Clostridia bacterium]